MRVRRRQIFGIMSRWKPGTMSVSCKHPYNTQPSPVRCTSSIQTCPQMLTLYMVRQSRCNICLFHLCGFSPTPAGCDQKAWASLRVYHHDIFYQRHHATCAGPFLLQRCQRCNGSINKADECRVPEDWGKSRVPVPSALQLRTGHLSLTQANHYRRFASIL